MISTTTLYADATPDRPNFPLTWKQRLTGIAFVYLWCLLGSLLLISLHLFYPSDNAASAYVYGFGLGFLCDGLWWLAMNRRVEIEMRRLRAVVRLLNELDTVVRGAEDPAYSVPLLRQWAQEAHDANDYPKYVQMMDMADTIACQSADLDRMRVALGVGQQP